MVGDRPPETVVFCPFSADTQVGRRVLACPGIGLSQPVTAGGSPASCRGVAGAKRGVKCLPAHYADTRGGNPNPVGELVIPWVEPLDCEVPCIVEHDGGATKNPQWTEPR